jgi:hypothetical protein
VKKVSKYGKGKNMATKKAIEKKYICYDGDNDRFIGEAPWDKQALIDELVNSYGGNESTLERFEIYEIIPTRLKVKLNVELVTA